MNRKKRKRDKNTAKIKTSYYTISSPKLPEPFCGYRIVHLSDLHGTLYGRNHKVLIQKIREAAPNCIMMTGDMADQSQGAIPRLIDLCSRLCRHWPVYFIDGNHEQCLKEKEQASLQRGLKRAGVIQLKNSAQELVYKGASIQVYGLVMPMVYYKDWFREYRWGIKFTVQDAERLLGMPRGDSFRILLAHNPLYFPAYRDWGADLTLSGHIHGGIICIPGLGGLLSPEVKFFPKYDGGYFWEEGKQMVVSRGLGNHFLFRLWNPPELAVITLKHP